jgi:hypothetical protein
MTQEIWTVYEADGRAPTVSFTNEEAARDHRASFPKHMRPVLHCGVLRGRAPTPLRLRIPMQILFVALTLWATQT